MPCTGARPGELKPLVSTINALLERIQRAIERKRTFTGNAAHELKTPLTAVKTHIQVARLAGGGNETGTTLMHAEQGVRRLQSTIEQLLMLARVDSGQSFEGEPADNARAMAEMALQQMPAVQRGRILIRDLGTTGAQSVPPVLAVTALRNILDNACRYSPAETDIVLTLSESEGAARFRVDDEGPGMGEDERFKAMQRFWRKGRGQGSGLGLSIVAAISGRYGGSFELLPRADGGLTAQLAFSLALMDHASAG